LKRKVIAHPQGGIRNAWDSSLCIRFQCQKGNGIDGNSRWILKSASSIHGWQGFRAQSVLHAKRGRNGPIASSHTTFTKREVKPSRDISRAANRKIREVRVASGNLEKSIRNSNARTDPPSAHRTGNASKSEAPKQENQKRGGSVSQLLTPYTGRGEMASAWDRCGENNRLVPG